MEADSNGLVEQQQVLAKAVEEEQQQRSSEVGQLRCVQCEQWNARVHIINMNDSLHDASVSGCKQGCRHSYAVFVKESQLIWNLR